MNEAEGAQEQHAKKKLNISAGKLLSVEMDNFVVIKKEGIIEIVRKKKEYEPSDFWIKREDVERMFATAKSLRDRCILKLLYFAMMRRNEVRSLRIEDVNFDTRMLNLQITKRGRPRSIPIISDSLLDDLRLVIGKRTSGWVFLSKSKDGRLSNVAINDIVAKAGADAGIVNPNPHRKKINPHILRHSFARYLRRQQPPIAIEVLQKLLGHKSVKTTMDIYASADMEFVRGELERCANSKIAQSNT